MTDLDTLQSLERTALPPDESPTFTPISTTSDRAWRRDFDRQFNQQTALCVLKQTKGLIRAAQEMTPWRDQLGAEDRLNNAVCKLLDGSRRWEPARVDLAAFLYGVVRSDVSHEIKHHKKCRHVSFDNDEIDLDNLEQETSDAMTSERTSKAEVSRDWWWRPLLGQFRALARGDHRVLALLASFEAGQFDRRDAIAFTGLSPRQHDAAYRRLRELSQQIDDTTRALVDQAIG